MEVTSELSTLALPLVNDLDNVNCKIENVIDVIAPVRVSLPFDKQKALWRNAKSIMIQKRESEKLCTDGEKKPLNSPWHI